MKNYLELFDTCVYAFDGAMNVMDEKDLGITGDIASLLTPERSVTQTECFQGCPYTCTSFKNDVIIDGERVRAAGWKWLPNAMLRWGKGRDIEVITLTAMIPGQRGMVEKITVKNLVDHDIQAPVEIMYRGRTRRDEIWRFSIPVPEVCAREDFSVQGQILSGVHDGCALRLTTSLEGITHFRRAYLWEGAITIPAGESVTFYISAHMGEETRSLAEAQAAVGHYEELLESSFAYLLCETERIEANLPHLTSDCPELDRLYYRSLVTYILCRWENPDLCVVPYYSTGSVNGSCMCSYLWDYCGGLMLHPVYDPEGNKKQLRAYLRNDLTQSFAVNPVNGGPDGPWYQINQEKITLMVYHHVRATGEVDFLRETVGERTVLEWMKYHAYVCDDLSRDVELYDYGQEGDHHLELMFFHNGPYNGIMPDLNARRWLNYMRVYELTVLAGEPDERLAERAAGLKEKLKDLWNEDAQWYDFIDAQGNRDIRYTVQMFKFLNSGVIDAHEREGLISHLNDREFLSKFGLHSMSKLDTQYDQDDIDNGGGGTCTHFAAQICAQLYEMGYDEKATDILQRIYWWGERMPYLGDSCAANMMLNREITPLQGDISSVSCAQMIFFYICGITPHFDGRVSISPVRVRPAQNMYIDNARLCGKVLSVDTR